MDNRTRRPSKRSDQKEAAKCYNILVDLTRKHPEIESNIWISAFFTAIASSIKETGWTFEQFVEEVMNGINHYRYLWEEE